MSWESDYLNRLRDAANALSDRYQIPNDYYRNAVQHAYGSAYTALDYGQNLARYLGWSKENRDLREHYNLQDTRKDYYNNEVGRRIAEFVDKNGLPREAVDSLIIDALEHQHLVVELDDWRISGLRPQEPSWNGPSQTWLNNSPYPPPGPFIPSADDVREAWHDFFHDPLRIPRGWWEEAKGWFDHLLSDPIVLDLDGDGIELTSVGTSTARFDLDGDGFAERVGWLSPQDALLFRDLNSNGLVDSVAELFGSASIDGFDALRAVDSNQDGKIDSSDVVFASMKIWNDVNSDGISSSNEVQTLSDVGITRIDLGYQQIDRSLAGNVIARASTFFRSNGTSGAVGSVQFAVDETGSFPSIPDDADLSNLLTLPNLPSLGARPDLYTVMFFDPVLREKVESLVLQEHQFSTFEEFANSGFIDILYRWAGIDISLAQSPGDKPYYIQALEVFLGRSTDTLNPAQLQRVEALWEESVRKLGIEFLVQAANRPAFAGIIALSDQLQALYDAAGFLGPEATQLIDSAFAQVGNFTPFSSYYNLFAHLRLDQGSGDLTGDFDSIVRAFLEQQPSFYWMRFASGGGSGGGGALTMDGTNGASVRHPWTAWYEDQGSLLFEIARSMGLGIDYVLNVTGWRWLAGDVSDLYGSDGNDVIDETITPYTRLSLEGFTTVSGETHDQRLFGLEGNDELRGNDGADRLIGGVGNDLLKGGSGSDMYVYSAGDGLDRVVDESGADDTIYFSSELDPGQLRVIRVPGTNDLLLHFGNPAAGMILVDQWLSPEHAIEHLHFVGQNGLNAGDIASLYLNALATSGADVISGGWADESIHGLNGDDSISGAGGADKIFGDDGNDQLNGGANNDTLDGGSGSDYLLGEYGNDMLIGGAGNDVLSGEEENDTYLFNRGDGQDIVRDRAFWGGGDDTIAFGPGIAPGDVIVTQADDGGDLVLSIVGTNDRITIDQTMVDGRAQIERVQFANGTVWTHADLVQRSVANNNGNDVFYGSIDGEVIDAGDGNDAVDARTGNDTLIGGRGNDILMGEEGNDTYVFARGDGQDIVRDRSVWGSGDDTIIFGSNILPADVTVTQADNGADLVLSILGTTDRITIDQTMVDWRSQIERVQFADGTIWTLADLVQRSLADNSGNNVFYGSINGDTLFAGSGNDIIDARDGNDTLIGGQGDDVLTGDEGNDTYVFARGDGQDIVRDRAYWGGGDDTIVFASNISPADVAVTQADNGADLVLSIAGTSDRITIDQTNVDWRAQIERVQFADGTTWTHADLVQRSFGNNDGNNVFYGSLIGEVIDGGDGDDTINARDGNDTLVGGRGNDNLVGGEGSDTYVFALGDGQDVINDWSEWGGIDTLLFSSGITAASISISQADNGNDLVINISGTSDRIVLDQAIIDRHAQLERVQFNDGTTWTHADLVQRSFLNNSGNDQFYGTAVGETIDGGIGDDVIISRDGNDTLVGGLGNDVLIGGEGADTYSFARGDGQDIVREWSEWGGTDTIYFGTGIAPGDVLVSRADDGRDLVLSIAGSTDSITIDQALIDGHAQVEQVWFADGTTWTHADLVNRSSSTAQYGNNAMSAETKISLSGPAQEELQSYQELRYDEAYWT